MSNTVKFVKIPTETRIALLKDELEELPKYRFLKRAELKRSIKLWEGCL